MTHVIRMSLAFSISMALFGCAHDGPGLRMMNDRAEYSDEAPETSELNLESSTALGEEGKLLARPEPRIAEVWIYPQRLSDREYFWGAWMSLRLEDEQWEGNSMIHREPSPPTARPKNGSPYKKKAKRS